VTPSNALGRRFLLLAIAGALTIFQPIQPVLGALGLVPATVALAIRVRGIRRGCRVDLPASAVTLLRSGAGSRFRARQGLPLFGLRWMLGLGALIAGAHGD
jgi:hypothetical protein